VQLPNQLVDIALARTDRAKREDCGLLLLGNGGDRNRFFVAIPTDEKGVIVCLG